MEVVCLISLHRILPFHDAYTDDVDEVDEINSEHRHCCRNLASCDDSESRDEESEHDRPRISHESLTRYIESCDSECDRYDDREYDEEKVAIFFCCRGCIDEKEFDRESAKDEK